MNAGPNRRQRRDVTNAGKNIAEKKNIEALCAAKGMRMTEQRRMIARVLARPTIIPTSRSSTARCAKVDEHISISTVYRTVRLFEDAGIIERHDFREGRARYETVPEAHHDHLINLRSGEVIEFQSEEIERLQAEIARKLGYKLVDHRLELYARAAQRRQDQTLMLRALSDRGGLLHDDAAADRDAMAARQARPARLGLHRVAIITACCARLLRIRVRVVGAPVRERAGAVRLQSCVVGRYRGDRLDRAGRLRRQERGARTGRWSASPPSCSARCSSIARAGSRPPTRSPRSSQRLAERRPVVLFAEGTSSDGNRVLPFRSALIGAVERRRRRGERGILIQPMSICYTGLHGIPMGRQHRPLVAWYGDLDFMPHIKAFIGQRRGRCRGDLRRAGRRRRDTDRKAMTQTLESTVRRLVAAAAAPAPTGCGAARASRAFISGDGPGKLLKSLSKSNIWSGGTNPATTG